MFRISNLFGLKFEKNFDLNLNRIGPKIANESINLRRGTKFLSSIFRLHKNRINMDIGSMISKLEMISIRKTISKIFEWKQIGIESLLGNRFESDQIIRSFRALSVRI
ncbi:kinesin-like protein KIF13B [Sarcoptes scabiei]|nr:kinesin-like protein KIF13B [Sarcoptes scabiei]